MGIVYRAQHLHLHRKVALKLLVPELAGDPIFRERFIRESRSAAAIHHPNIVTVYDAGEFDALLYIAMQYVEGDDLAGLLRRGGSLPAERALAILDAVAAALDAAHASGLIHRDVKPGNVLLGGGRTYLSDFGLAKPTRATTPFTTAGQFLGTIDYAAPEQIRSEALDARTDVYALGCVLYECLVGVPPYRRDSEIATICAHVLDPPPRASAQRPGLPAGLDAVIARALSKGCEERYASCATLMAEARSALENGDGGGTVTTRQTSAAGLKQSAPKNLADASTTAEGPDAATPARPTLALGQVFRRAARSRTTARGLVALRSRRASRRAASGRSRRARGLPMLGALALALLSAGVAVVILMSEDEPPRQDRPKRASASPPAAASAVVSGKPIPVGSRPFGVAVGRGGVWIANTSDDEVRRLDPSTRRVVGPPIPVGRGALAVTLGLDWLWVTNFRAGTLTRIDPVGGTSVGSPIRVGREPFSVAVGVDDRSVWVANASDDSVSRIDATLGRAVGAAIAVGDQPRAVATVKGAVWVANSGDDTVTRIDTKTGRVGRVIPVGEKPNGVAVGSGSLWVTNNGDDSVSRIDIRTRRVVGRPIRVGNAPVGVAFGLRQVWVANSGDDTVTRIDARSGRPAGRPIPVGREPVGIKVGAGAVWVTNNDDGTVSRIAVRARPVTRPE